MVAAFAGALRYGWNRYRWRRFSRLAKSSIERIRAVGMRDMETYSPESWRYQVQTLLEKSYFTPFEIEELRESAQIHAAGIAAEHFVLR